jgi:UDP-N-acetylmuramyl pentapeptide phosphotransferase/UDP-N-acetylglucosamine-1-phosphate transferase
MDSDFRLIDLNLPYWIKITGGFLTAFIITLVSIPTIVKIAKFKNLYDYPNERKSHKDEIPNLGGLAIIAGFIVSLVIFSLNQESDEIKFILGGMAVLFFIGLKDDILVIDPKKKFIGQIIASFIVVLLGNIRISCFFSAPGTGSISFILSVLVTIFLFIILINGFNLIDGVDGLASSTGVLSSIAFGIWFILTNHITYAVMCFALTGSLIAFFRFNVFGKENKIFMGDTGSLAIGLIIAVFTVKFIELQKDAPLKYQFESALAVAFGLLIIPIFDTTRVFFLRLFNGISPFKADRNHMHHSLLMLGNSHIRATVILLTCNLILYLLAVSLQWTGNVILIVLIILIATLLSVIPRLLLRHRKKKISIPG